MCIFVAKIAVYNCTIELLYVFKDNDKQEVPLQHVLIKIKTDGHSYRFQLHNKTDNIEEEDQECGGVVEDDPVLDLLLPNLTNSRGDSLIGFSACRYGKYC